MTNQTIEKTIRSWARIGGGFLVEPAETDPDPERLLIETARFVPYEPRLFLVAASWLCRYFDLVAKQRLENLVSDELTEEEKSQLGLLLDTVAVYTKKSHFKNVIALCKPANPARPLYKFQENNPIFRKLAEKRASALSRRWGLWTDPFEVKSDAIRPASWVFEHNPTLCKREVFGGDLRATIVATLEDDPGVGESEQRLIQACKASRDAVRKSLDWLTRYEHVERNRHANRLAVAVIFPNDRGLRTGLSSRLELSTKSRG
jgi:hypothetical protein